MTNLYGKTINFPNPITDYMMGIEPQNLTN